MQFKHAQSELVFLSTCFQTEHSFSTKINDLLLAVANLTFGDIQGGVPGPLMFLIYINCFIMLLSRFGVKVKLFADDAELYVNQSCKRCCY